MHPLHEHLARQVADKLKRRRVVVWYDERCEFVDFIEELSVGAVTLEPIHPVRVGEVAATLARHHDSVISLRVALEPRVAADWPDPLLVYLPGESRPPKYSMLMELEKAGECIGDTSAWSLKRQARNCLSRHFTDGKIDELLKTEALAYSEVVRMLEMGGGGGGASPLKLLYPDRKTADLLADWLVDPAADDAILSRGAAEGVPLASVDDRLQLLRGRVPGARSLRLAQVLDASAPKLRSEVEGAPMIIVRSVEIDESGEGGSAAARALFGAVIHNLARAIRKLASAGVEHFVVTADHGHQFVRRKEADASIDKPGTAEVDLHRRVWVGRGGQTTAACVRVRAADLGYAGDLDYVFPRGLGVFKAGGDLIDKAIRDTGPEGWLDAEELLPKLSDAKPKPTTRQVRIVQHEGRFYA